MEEIHKISWNTLEYEHKEKNIDWFWALGLIIFSSALASIIFKNYFFAILIILAGVLLGYFSHRKPKELKVEFENKGIHIGDTFHKYEEIKSFFIQTGEKNLLFLKQSQALSPLIVLDINPGHATAIKNIMNFKNIKEEEMKEGFSEKIMAYFDL